MKIERLRLRKSVMEGGREADGKISKSCGEKEDKGKSKGGKNRRKRQKYKREKEEGKLKRGEFGKHLEAQTLGQRVLINLQNINSHLQKFGPT